MPFDLVALAQNGAATIVAAMAADVWPAVRGRLGRLFGNGDATLEEQALAELDEARAAIDHADGDHAAGEALGELRGALKARLRTDPDLAAAFQALVDEVAAQLPTPVAGTTITQHARADRGSTVIQAGRDVNR
ncbi:hypothetical protein ACFO1B_57070 [Dactylosporangium siamense]|uniref:Uncharacterized protein n=1 Tax=Dactylosporangium siamense TaxID=685454 RepID=A0A919PZI3_9ACTN|nr:hypothetical protein [Dactylosporangium siamense]GIG53239.1 hypothetical protein Dsi01nite_112800 [Dactylosporangium siamense]